MVKRLAAVVILIMLAQSAGSFIMPKIIWKGSPETKVVALTFDDGPKPEYSQKVLDILTKYAVKATFFVVGREAADFPDIIMRMHDEGHEIGNHTFSHSRVSAMSVSALKTELKRTNRIIHDITGKSPVYFRPPGGDYVFKSRYVASKCGLEQVNWSVNAGDFVSLKHDFEIDEDYQKEAMDLADKVVEKTGSGDIVLFHNGSEETIRALPVIIERLKAKGYSFVTITRLIKKGDVDVI